MNNFFYHQVCVWGSIFYSIPRWNFKNQMFFSLLVEGECYVKKKFILFSCMFLSGQNFDKH